MEDNIEHIRRALIPIIGDGEATKQILEIFGSMPELFGTPLALHNKEIEVNHIVTRGVVQFRVIKINDDTYATKSWDGNSAELLKSEVALATNLERTQYYRNQVEFLRTNIAPFLNFFSMRQLANQVKEPTAKESMDRQLNIIEQDCFTKLQDIKKLW